MNSINCNGKLLSLSKPQIMAIVNMTPDSFHRGSRVSGIDDALSKISHMIAEGAAIIDIGGQSSRPRANRISAEDELVQVLEPIREIRKAFPDMILSVDTFYSHVASSLIEVGVDMVNDISAGSIDPEIFRVIGQSSVAYVLMHMLGTPQTMQDNPNYDSVCMDILTFLKNKIYDIERNDITEIVIDPGIGFGKTVDQNFEILRKLNVFKILNRPMMVGLSRKSLIYKTLNVTSQEALNGTSVLHLAALQQGAKILRVHDVKEARETITLFESLKGS